MSVEGQLGALLHIFLELLPGLGIEWVAIWTIISGPGKVVKYKLAIPGSDTPHFSHFIG